jgi:NADPH:quinone reductase-like Zn-dependent oxidoreductase
MLPVNPVDWKVMEGYANRKLPLVPGMARRRCRPFAERCLRGHLVLDTMGGETQKRSWQVLKRGGILVSILSQPSQKEADAWGVRGAFFIVRPNAAELTQIADLVDSGKVKPSCRFGSA